MATKSAGMPSDTASSASPRYRRTFATSSTSLNSRQSRIASAISVGVISSSPAPSATELAAPHAFRTPPAARPGIGPCLPRRLAGPDDHTPLRLFADASAGHIRIAFEREVDGPALERLHRVKGDRVARHLHLARCAHRDLAHRVLAALAVALDVHDDPLAFGEVSPPHHVGHRLEGSQGFAPPADQGTQVATADVERDRISTSPHGALSVAPPVLE